MKFATLILALGGVVVTTGCSSLISLNPFVTDQEAITDAALPGVWNTDDKDGMFAIRQAGSTYTIVYSEGSSAPMKFEARLFLAGDAKLLDLVSTNEDPFQVPAHLLVRVWPEGSTLRWAFLDSDWFKQQAAEHLSNHAAGDRTLLTAPPVAVRSFVMKYGAGEKAYDKQQTLTKAQ
ncbi:MAG: hypothetical protein LAQ69_18105 [Acidobacteriia bacterium]|nr:hypothetical protein [Terriglobia bacterium]